MAAILEGKKLRLSGIVGDDNGFDQDHFIAADVVLALAAYDDRADLTVHINSPGGWAMEGAAIHSILVARPGRTDVVVEGVAASAGSLIAMAGATVTMSAGAVMMIHDPRSFTFGTTDDHSRTIHELEVIATAYARVYAGKSGKSPEECREIMKAETWLEGQQAVDEGFADKTTDGRSKAVAAFDYRLFANAPERLKAMATAKKWRLPPHDEPTSPRKEPAMSAKTVSTDAHLAATARIKAIMQAPEAKDRNDLAEHLAFNTTMEADAALAIMKAAPVATNSNDLSDAELLEFRRTGQVEMRRYNGEGLNGKPAISGGGIVEAMKRRHGVGQER